ncbi:MAG: hypothetical protein LBK99_10885, partial [Opitutaceae bacterium]|nr:hypothetical protein [Opitutaceae bacterium]
PLPTPATIPRQQLSPARGGSPPPPSPIVERARCFCHVPCPIEPRSLVLARPARRMAPDSV